MDVWWEKWFRSVTLSHCRFSSCYCSKTNSILTVSVYIIILSLCFEHWGFREGTNNHREGNRTQVYQNQIQCFLRSISKYCKYRNSERSPMNTWRQTGELCQHYEEPLPGWCGEGRQRMEVLSRERDCSVYVDTGYLKELLLVKHGIMLRLEFIKGCQCVST